MQNDDLSDEEEEVSHGKEFEPNLYSMKNLQAKTMILENTQGTIPWTKL
jgi:hypothetical protein